MPKRKWSGAVTELSDGRRAVDEFTIYLAKPPGKRTLLGAPGPTTRSKKLLGTSATLVVTGALLVVTRSY